VVNIEGNHGGDVKSQRPRDPDRDAIREIKTRLSKLEASGRRKATKRDVQSLSDAMSDAVASVLNSVIDEIIEPMKKPIEKLSQ
jgi:hypothetical protein